MASFTLLTAFVSSLASFQAAERTGELRAVSVALTAEKDRPAPTGLAPEEVVVLENGVAREVTRIERDTRPLDLALLVDTSAAVGSTYRLHLVEPILALLARLPAGSRYALWATGDRPTRLTELEADATAARKALTRVVPQGGNTLLDAIVEASEDLKRREGGRRAMVVVSALGVEFSSRDRLLVVDRVRDQLDLFSAVLFDEAGIGASDIDQRFKYEYVLSQLADHTGGLFERPLSSLAAASALRALGQDLAGRFLIRYATLPEIKERRLEVRVARPGVKVRVPRSGRDAS